MNKENQKKWLNVCVDCGHRVTTYGLNQVGQCPECAKTSKSKGWRWLSHLESPHDNHRQRCSVKNSAQTPSASIFTGRGIMSPLKGIDKPTVKGKTRGTQGDLGGNGHRGRPKLDIPEALIKKLHKKGYGAKRIAQQLSEQYGVPVSYQTILRRLSNNGNGKTKKKYRIIPYK